MDDTENCGSCSLNDELLVHTAVKSSTRRLFFCVKKRKKNSSTRIHDGIEFLKGRRTYSTVGMSSVKSSLSFIHPRL